MVRIGVTSKLFSQERWFIEAAASPWRVLEINRRSSELWCGDRPLETVRSHLAGFVLSMHSGTHRVFETTAQFTETEISMVKSEIVMCQRLGATELNVHLPEETLTEDQGRVLNELLALAHNHGITLMVENNSGSPSETLLDLLRRFPGLMMNLDIGHLNRQLQEKLITLPLDEYIRAIRDRVVYVHAHNNKGQADEHKSLDYGTLEWRDVLDKLDLTRTRTIILEQNDPADVASSERLLRHYLEGKSEGGCMDGKRTDPVGSAPLH